MKKIFIIFFLLISFTLFSQTTHTVNAGNYYYSPSELTVNQGDIVVWINDGCCHDVNGAMNTIAKKSKINPRIVSG